MEKLAVEGRFSVAASGSTNPEGKADRWLGRTVLTKEEREGVKLAGNERQEMEVRRLLVWEAFAGRHVCPHSSCFPLDDFVWWLFGHGDGNDRKKMHCGWWCAACDAQYDWRSPNRILVV